MILMDCDERIDLIRSDRWIAFDRATIVLNRLISLMEMPRQSRMPGLMIYGSSGIGKTMIAKRMAGLYPFQYASDVGVTKTPILLLQAPPAPDERRFYQHILASIGAPVWGRNTVSELEVRVLNHLRDMDLKMIMIDEVHNLLAGSYREQRRFLNMLRFLANDLCASLVVFGVNEAVDAIRGDEQLARRLDEHFLPLWEDDVEFSRLVQTLISAMQLERGSGLSVQSLRSILGVSGGVTSRVFTMVKALAIDAIETGEERITDEAIQTWQPTWAKHSWNIRRQPLPAFS
ncbi:TniB family NTP-binding protein [Cognatiyoonia sp. IB215182]|uniref:TniB family NTP-binding protein n=1 Tax=Cognatiyoonia sp. IB215182 TaxID=3097353 RepID=UPI002A15D9D2|nr:TniB family NTP-binding protein [Cognatiyoonia sp. IB215182]MDX8354838.1 TniB family NTP-binding protein [Cognatiyoonia sp. IB215182]